MAHLSPAVLSARRRALSYRDADGLSELVVGVALMVFGSQDFFSAKLAPFGHLGQAAVALCIMALYLLLMIGSTRIIEWLKEELVYPRTGYVATANENVGPEGARRNSWHVFLAIALMVAVISLAASLVIYARWIWAIGLFVLYAFYLLVSGQFRRDPLRSWLFLVPLAVGMTWWAFLKPSPPFISLLVIVGAALVLAGFIRLAVYLLRNPRPRSPENVA
jgi:hypothetical protein